MEAKNSQIQQDSRPDVAAFCSVCSFPMHRYGFPRDWNNHDPSAVACANMIIPEIDLMLSKVDPDAKAHVRERIDRAITKLAIEVQQERYERSKRSPQKLEDALGWIANHPAWKQAGCLEPVDVRPGKTQDCDACGPCFSRIAQEALERGHPS